MNHRNLWISLLASPAVALLAVLCLPISDGSFSIFLLYIACPLTALFCWVLFINEATKRFRGGSMVMLFLAFPLSQIIVCSSIFFSGCLLTLYLS